MYAEAGSHAYARAHRLDAGAELLGAALLCRLAWCCIRMSRPGPIFFALASGLVVATIWRGIAAYYRVPKEIHPAGGNWYVVQRYQAVGREDNIYAVYYKHRGHYQVLDWMVSEYQFVPPDCLSFRGLSVDGRAKYAMCGDRSPTVTYDTTTADSTMLAMARAQPRFRDLAEEMAERDHAARIAESSR